MTLGSVFKYNFMPDFRDFSNGQRTYALNDERGLLLCTWPKGGRPPLPFVYSDEVWTGIEYHVASHLIYEGLVDEGLTVAKAVRDRYDGLKRNPWDEIECGHHYARAMSSWGLILALSGFAYSGPDMTLGFAPKIYADDFRSFWSTGSGWGSYSQKTLGGKSQKSEVEIVQGGLSLKEFRFARPESMTAKSLASLKVEAAGKPVKAAAVLEGRTVKVKFEAPVVLKAGDKLTLAAAY
jgi:non-lysosomal glucosylceramidase